MTKRIAIAIDSLAGGGAEKVMLTLAASLIELGHEPHLILLQDYCSHAVDSAIPVHACFSQKEKNLDSFWKLNSSAARLKAFIAEVEAKVGKFDLFLSNLDKTNLLMSKTNVSPLFFIVHNSIEEELARQRKLGPFAYWDMLKAKKALNNQHLVTVSNGIANEIKTAGRVRPASVQTIYNPFELERIREQANEVADGIPTGDYLVHVGRFARQKRHDVLFQALSKMTHKLPLVLLCNNKKKALKVAKKYGVESQIIVPGFQTNPYPWIKNAKLLVLSSDYEGLPTVLIESLAVGTPIVSTNCDHGPKEILSSELAQFLVPRRSPEKLAETIDAALTAYPNCENADILQQVGSKQVAEKYLALFNK